MEDKRTVSPDFETKMITSIRNRLEGLHQIFITKPEGVLKDEKALAALEQLRRAEPFINSARELLRADVKLTVVKDVS